MATDIMECADPVVFTANEKDWEPGNVERLIRAGLFKLGAVGKIEPCLELYVSVRQAISYWRFYYLAEERAPFELEDFPTAPPSFWDFGFFGHHQV